MEGLLCKKPYEAKQDHVSVLKKQCRRFFSAQHQWDMTNA